MNYNNKKFRAFSTSENSEVTNEVIFHYKQRDNIVSCTYNGGTIVSGHLLGTVDDNGLINMHYHQYNSNNELMTGICTSTPEILADGRIRLHEKWQWTNGDQSEGESILEEVI